MFSLIFSHATWQITTQISLSHYFTSKQWKTIKCLRKILQQVVRGCKQKVFGENMKEALGQSFVISKLSPRKCVLPNLTFYSNNKSLKKYSLCEQFNFDKSPVDYISDGKGLSKNNFIFSLKVTTALIPVNCI